jgi:putative transposase
MVYNPEIHHRRSIRVKGYDYSRDGAYFVTICAQDKKCLFGNIAGGKMELNGAGEMVRDYWIDLNNRFPNIETDLFVVMPNHFHGILSVGAGLVSARPEFPIMENKARGNTIIRNTNARADMKPAPTNANAKTLGDIICAFKSLTTNEYIGNVKSGKFPPFEKSIWQRNYWEYIIRDDDDLDRIRKYIADNPLDWELDELYRNS